MKKIIVVTPDQFLDLYKNLSHCHVQFSSPGVYSSLINLVLNKKLHQHNQQLLHGSDERLSLEISVYASLNDGNFTESTQLTKCAF